MEEIKLLGKVLIKGKIKAKSGLAIGGSTVGLDIGGVDNPVIKDAEGKPYIPGSSLKGKMRSLLEKELGLATEDERVWVVKGRVSIHMCNEPDCKVCNIFGRNNGKQTKVSGEEIEITQTTPTRLIVRDAFLTEESEKWLKELPTDLEYTEVKFENVIDRITSAANPRQMERVPTGAEFDFEMIYNVFNEKDKENLKEVFEAMKLLEDDYLGSSGSRGYGKIKFENVNIYWNSKEDYEKGVLGEEKGAINENNTTSSTIVQNFEKIKEKIR